MRNLVIIMALLALGACNDSTAVPQLATTRLCDTVSYYIAIIRNPTNQPFKAKYIVYVDTNNNKKVESTEPVFYRSPILDIGKFDERLTGPIPIDTLWNKNILITELQTTYGEMIIDHVHPCERHVNQ